MNFSLEPWVSETLSVSGNFKSLIDLTKFQEIIIDEKYIEVSYCWFFPCMVLVLRVQIVQDDCTTSLYFARQQLNRVMQLQNEITKAKYKSIP